VTQFTSVSDLDQLRAQLAETDRTILDAFSKRVGFLLQVREHKRRNDLRYTDLTQEERLLNALADANPGPASSDGVRELFTFVLALAKREAEKIETAD
jgi:chorismate mutase